MGKTSKYWITSDMVKSIQKCIVFRERIPEDSLDNFVSAAIKIVNYSDVTRIHSSYKSLSNNVLAYWRSGKYMQESDVTFVYQIGQLVACTRMIDGVLDYKIEQEQFDSMCNHWEIYLPFYFHVANTPGIRHKELADQLEQSPSALTQFYNKHKLYQYCSKVSVGREKYYRLTPKGKILLDQLLEQREATERIRVIQERTKTIRRDLKELKEILISAVNEDSYYTEKMPPTLLGYIKSSFSSLFGVDFSPLNKLSKEIKWLSQSLAVSKAISELSLDYSQENTAIRREIMKGVNISNAEL